MCFSSVTMKDLPLSPNEIPQLVCPDPRDILTERIKLHGEPDKNPVLTVDPRKEGPTREVDTWHGSEGSLSYDEGFSVTAQNIE